MWRVWIEISERAWIDVPTQESPSVWRVWIEIPGPCGLDAFAKSPSVWRVWIEIL